jgi:hypothetical protein
MYRFISVNMESRDHDIYIYIARCIIVSASTWKEKISKYNLEGNWKEIWSSGEKVEGNFENRILSKT